MGLIEHLLDAIGTQSQSADSWGSCAAPGCRRRAVIRYVVGWRVIMFDRHYEPNDVVFVCRRHRKPEATPYTGP